jgi:hypothetical protein
MFLIWCHTNDDEAVGAKSPGPTNPDYVRGSLLRRNGRAIFVCVRTIPAFLGAAVALQTPTEAATEMDRANHATTREGRDVCHSTLVYDGEVDQLVEGSAATGRFWIRMTI